MFAINQGIVDPSNLKFNLKAVKSINETLQEKSNAFGDFYQEKYAEIHCELPYIESKNLSIFKNILNDKRVRLTLNL